MDLSFLINTAGETAYALAVWHEGCYVTAEQLSLLPSFNIAQTRHTATTMDRQLISRIASLPMR
jgi:hypothetical protein